MLAEKKKRGTKPQGKVRIEWSADFAYAIGLIVTDGCLSPDGRHVTFVSKDLEQVENFCKALRIQYVPKLYSNGSGKMAYRIQIGDVRFYNYLLSIGIMPKKSLVIGRVDIPDRYFSHYLRGCLDGDGYTHSYFDPRWKSSFMFYIGFVSASKEHVIWLQEKICKHTGCGGHWSNHGKGNGCYHLRYSKHEAIPLAKFMYRNKRNMFLTRKHLKVKQVFDIVGHRI